MGDAHQSDLLASGLRALGVMARHSPVAIDQIAALAGISSQQTAQLVETLMHSGYVVRCEDGAHYILTEWATEIVPPRCSCPPHRLH